MRRTAYGLFAALCCAAFALQAQAGPAMTYTWQTLSSMGSRNLPAPELAFSFTVDGPVSVDANSDFANSGEYNQLPATPIQYQFPANLLAFSLRVGFLSITPSDFTSPNYVNAPRWDLTLNVDPVNATASIGIFFLSATDTDQIAGSAQFTDAYANTGAVTTFYYYSDAYPSNGPASYTGFLDPATTAVPEPRSLWVLIAGITMLGLIIRRADRFDRVGR